MCRASADNVQINADSMGTIYIYGAICGKSLVCMLPYVVSHQNICCHIWQVENVWHNIWSMYGNYMLPYMVTVAICGAIYGHYRDPGVP